MVKNKTVHLSYTVLIWPGECRHWEQVVGFFQSCEKCASLLRRCWIYTNAVRSPRSLVARGEACRGRCLILGSCTVSLPKHLGYSPSRSYSTIFICSSNSCGYRVHSYQPSYITGLLTENTSHNSSCHILILHQRSRQLLWVNTHRCTTRSLISKLLFIYSLMCSDWYLPPHPRCHFGNIYTF